MADGPKQKGEVCSNPENICIDEETLAEGDVSGNGKNGRFDAKSYWESQKYAFSGLKLIFVNERNFRIQLVVAFCAVGAGIFFQISHQDWVALFIVMAIVLVAEAVNSVVEAICDTISKDFRINIKYAKDVSAGSVLVSAMVSLIAGVLIFSPYIWQWLTNLL